MKTQKNQDDGINPKGARWPIHTKLKMLLWRGVNATLFRYSPFFFYGWRRFLLRMFGAVIAKGATTARSAIIDSPWNLTMGENSMIARNAWVMCSGKVHIGKNSLIGEYAKILAGSHKSSSKDYDFVMAPIYIEDECWIASGAMVVAGGTRPLKIGRGAIVGAGSVVFSNVKAMTIVVGNPAEYLTDRVVE